MQFLVRTDWRWKKRKKSLFYLEFRKKFRFYASLWFSSWFSEREEKSIVNSFCFVRSVENKLFSLFVVLSRLGARISESIGFGVSSRAKKANFKGNSCEFSSYWIRASTNVVSLEERSSLNLIRSHRCFASAAEDRFLERFLFENWSNSCRDLVVENVKPWF